MADIRIVTGKNIVPKLETVLGLLEYKGEGHTREEIIGQYDKLLPKLRVYLKPKAALAFGEAPEEFRKLTGHEKLVCVVLTVGRGADTLCQSFFDRGDAFSAFLVSAMADASLFAFEEQVQGYLRRLCEEEGFGICARLSAPEDLPMEMQKTACDLVEAGRTLGLSLTSACMLEPEKSMCYFLAVTEDKEVFLGDHNCNACANLNCGARQAKVTLTVENAFGEKKISCKTGDKLQDVLLAYGIDFPRPCGGAGKCGKCRIKVIEGVLPVTRAEENCLTKEERQAGIHLGCQARIRGDVRISIESEKGGTAQILGSAEGEKFQNEMPGEGIFDGEDSSYGVAVDIGTTTLAFSLAGLDSKKVIHSRACMNPQRAFGFDVMSRIQASNQGMGQKLKILIQEELARGIDTLRKEKDIPGEKVKKIVLSGNTTMLHLLRGYSCQGLGAAPFTPVSLKGEILSFQEVFDSRSLSAVVILPPGASAFIGTDILSGLFACGWQEQRETTLFLDLGTNGEMALGDCDSFFTASTAVGPAFEGGNITFGTGSIRGAVSGAVLKDGKLKVTTIQDAPPVGICGTGLIEIGAELLKAGIIDGSGRLSKKYFETGFPVAKKENGEVIRLFQKDIRQLQLAKAAVRAGIEILLKKRSIGYKDVSRVYLAGGFGFYLSKEKAAAIGLLPGELLEKTIAVGNTSLRGAEYFLTREDAGEILDHLAAGVKEVSLAKEPEFQELYVRHMDFLLPEDLR